MRYELLHIINRCYIHTPEKNVSKAYSDVIKDIVTPDNIYNLIKSPRFVKHDTHNYFNLFIEENTKLSEDIECCGYYVASYNPEMFIHILDLKSDIEILAWLNKFWYIEFIVSPPILINKNNNKRFIYDLKNLECRYLDDNIDNIFDYLIDNACFTVANGLTIALSLNSLNIWDTKIFKHILAIFIQDKEDLVEYDVSIWSALHGYTSNIYEYPLMYALQHCNDKIYRLIYQVEGFSNEYIYFTNNIYYISNLYTCILEPKKHQYDFLNEIRYTKLIEYKWPYMGNTTLHHNIHQFISLSCHYGWYRRSFMKKGIIYGLFRDKVYINNYSCLLKFIRSISFLYNQKNINRRYLKLIWRSVIQHFPKETYYFLWLYLLIYKHVENPMKCFNLPPIRFIKDIIYMKKKKNKYHKEIHFDFGFLSSKLRINLKLDKVKSIRISPYNIMKIFADRDIDYNKLQTAVRKREMTPLLCMYRHNYILYTVMQKYYSLNPEELWNT
jgi:hypothetical protein